MNLEVLRELIHDFRNQIEHEPGAQGLKRTKIHESNQKYFAGPYGSLKFNRKCSEIYKFGKTLKFPVLKESPVLSKSRKTCLNNGSKDSYDEMRDRFYKEFKIVSAETTVASPRQRFENHSKLQELDQQFDFESSTDGLGISFKSLSTEEELKIDIQALKERVKQKDEEIFSLNLAVENLKAELIKSKAHEQ